MIVKEEFKQNKLRQEHVNQLGDIFLTNHEGVKLVCGSEVYQTDDGHSSFMAINVDTGYSQLITFKIEEL